MYNSVIERMLVDVLGFIFKFCVRTVEAIVSFDKKQGSKEELSLETFISHLVSVKKLITI